MYIHKLNNEETVINGMDFGIPIWSFEQAVLPIVPAIVELHEMPSEASLGHSFCSTNNDLVCNYLQLLWCW